MTEPETGPAQTAGKTGPGQVTGLLIDLLFVLVTLLPGLIFLGHTGELIKNSATVWTLKNGVFHHFDFVSFYACGAMILHGQARDVYDTTAQLTWYNHVIAPASVPYTNFLQHVPYVFSFLPLLAMLPLRTSYLAWIAASGGFALAGTALLRFAKARSLPLNVLDTAIFTLLMLTSLPGNFCLLDGQISWFYFFVLALFTLAFLQGRQLTAGLSLAVLSIKPQYFLFMLLPLIFTKKKKALLVCAIALLLLVVFAGLTIGFQNVWHYPQVLLHGEAAEHFALEKPKSMLSVRGPLSILLPNKQALILCFVAEIFALGACAIMWRQAEFESTGSTRHERRKNLAAEDGAPERRKRMLVITQISMLVASAHFYLYEGLLMAVPALLSLPSWRPTLAARLASSHSQALLNLLFLAFPLANLIILLGAPTLAGLILPAPLLTATEDNGIKGNLFVYVCLFLYNAAILAASISGTTMLSRGSGQK